MIKSLVCNAYEIDNRLAEEKIPEKWVISITAVDVYWRIEHRSLFELAVLSDPDGLSFDIPDIDGNTARVWFDLDSPSTAGWARLRNSRYYTGGPGPRFQEKL